MKRPVKRLALRADVVRTLSPDLLADVRGGADTDSGTYHCASVPPRCSGSAGNVCGDSSGSC